MSLGPPIAICELAHSEKFYVVMAGVLVQQAWRHQACLMIMILKRLSEGNIATQGRRHELRANSESRAPE